MSSFGRCSNCGGALDTAGVCHACRVNGTGTEAGTVRDPTLVPSRYFIPCASRKGWQCPVCGNVYAPFVDQCFQCNKKRTVPES